MAKKRKIWFKRIIGVTLAAAMIIQPQVANLSGIGVVRAEENVNEASEPVELITNGDFSDISEDGASAANWRPYVEAGVTVKFENGRAVYDIQSIGGLDWSTYLAYNEGISLVKGKEYHISFHVVSSVDRTIQAAFDGGRMGLTKQEVKANEDTVFSYTYTATEDYQNNTFMIYLGSIMDVTNPAEAHIVEISDVSITTNDSAGGSGGNQGGNVDEGEDNGNGEGGDTNEYAADGEYVAPVEGNLLTNGNFENKGADWNFFEGNTTVYKDKYRIVFHNTASEADYNQGLWQEVRDLSNSNTYKVSFDVVTSVARKVMVDMNDRSPRQFISETIPAGEKTTVSFTTSDVNNGTNKFFIYLGNNPEWSFESAHTVEISNVSIVEMPIEYENAVENDEAPVALTNIRNLDADAAVALKDGCFTDGVNLWEPWSESWITTDFKNVDNGVEMFISQTGANPWDAQLNQRIDLKKDFQYTISFDVHTEKARALNVVIVDLEGGDFNKTIGLQKDETRHVVLNIPVQSQDAMDKLFSLQLGKVAGDVTDNTLTFSDMKIEVNGYEALAVCIDDGDFTDGKGSFEAHTVEGADISMDAKSVKADITEETKVEDVILSRGGLVLEEGVTYSLSFVAGATSGSRDISVKLPDGTTKVVHLTDDAVLYSMDLTPTVSTDAGKLEFLLGGVADHICLDTVRLDAKGFAQAKGLKLDQNNIAALTKFTAPMLSEDISVVAGEAVVLTYADEDGAYTEAITGIKVNGKVVAEDKYTVQKGEITLDGSLFTIKDGEERQTYIIEVNAYWYEPAYATQIVYKTNQWTLTWSDEFNGTELNMDNWSYQEGTGVEYGVAGWGNNEQQYYTRDNLTVADGALTLTATTEDRGGMPYSSARIWSMREDQEGAKFAQTYGRFEAKIKMPAGEGCEGLWPAFWLLPVDSPYGGWPVSGEIDIMEARGRVGNSTDSTLHFGKTYPNEATAGSSYVWEDDADAITDYHIYSVDWTPTYMSFQVDGEEFYRVDNWYCEGAGEPQKYSFPAPFDQDFYIILNLAVGGAYDGNKNPSEAALPAEMKVDYVRVYESAIPVDDGYIAPEPEMETDETPEGAKTALIDPNFTDVKKVVKDTDAKNTDGWNLLTLSDFGGAANFETADINGDVFAKINITNGGNQNYSVQLTQKLELYKGHWYTLSFDAKADSAREIIAKLGGDGTNSWSTYNASTTKLGTSVQHYEYTFQMLNDSDPSSRLEMNMGLGSPNSVYIGNVEFQEADGYVIYPDGVKTPMENGNHIYNGSFAIGDVSRMAYWHTSDETSKVVKEGKEYFFQAQNDTTLYQNGIELLQSDTYKLTFDAKAAQEQELTVVFKDAEGKEYHTADILAGTTAKECEVVFTMPKGVTDLNGIVAFEMKAGMSIDHIVLVRETYNNVNFDGLNCYPLTNGDFELGDMGWSSYGTALSVVETDGNKNGRIPAQVGGNRWDSMMIYSDLELIGGYDYEFSFDAKAGADVDIDVCMEDVNYTRHFEQNKLAVGTQWNTYTYSFKLSSDVSVSLKFLAGAMEKATNIDIDNVVLRMKGAPQASGVILADSYHKLGEDLKLKHTGTADWVEAVVLMLDGKVIAEDMYSFEGDTITLDASLFTKTGEYTISTSAEGYASTEPIIVKLYPANGDRICNGDFNAGNTAWKQYIHGGNSAILTTDKGYLGAGYLHAQGDEWGNPSVPWSIQWNQDITIDEGGSYDISFVGFSEIERYIMVAVAGQSAKIKLTTEPMVHTVTVTIGEAGSYELQLQMGSVDPDTDSGYFPSEGFADFEPHSFYLDDISMLPADTKVDKSGSELYGEVEPVIPDEEEEVITNPFGDVQEDIWFYSYVMFAYRNGLMGGKGAMADGRLKFDPSNTITRAEFVQILYSKEGKPEIEYTDTFADVSDGLWYTDAIMWAYEHEIVGGKSTNFFDVSGNITRQEIAVILYKYALFKGYDVTKAQTTEITGFADAETVANWGMTSMKWAVGYDIIGGKKVAEDRMELSPNGNAIRAEAATMMQAFLAAYEGV